jgi:RHS repeat-associated protein
MSTLFPDFSEVIVPYPSWSNNLTTDKTIISTPAPVPFIPVKSYLTGPNTFKHRMTCAKRFWTLTYKGNLEATYTYNALGQRTNLLLGNGVWTNYAYNHSQRWLTDLQNYSVTNTLISGFSYAHDLVNNRISMQVGDWQALTETLTYSYDKNYQLLSEERRSITSTLLYAISWQYDEVGNRLSQVKGDGLITNTTTSEYNNANQLIAQATNGITDTTYTYDGNGNQTQKWRSGSQIAGWAYDYENRQVGYTDMVTSANNASYTYDAMGRRISKTVNSVVEKYLYDGANIIADYNGSGNLTASYVTPFLDQNLLVSRIVNLVSQTYYYMQDGLGSVRNIIDSTQAVKNTYDYYAFGEAFSVSEHATLTGQRYRFTSREWDAESQTIHHRYRNNDPRIGRFLSADPLGYDAGINLYSYVRNNPANNTDPYGLYEEDVHRYLTTLLALMSCFSRKEAEEIGNASQGVDEDPVTDGHPWLREEGEREQREWHFPVQPPADTVTRPDRGNNVALQKYNNATTNFELGRSMHVIEDSFSHAGYKAGLGHWWSNVRGKSVDKTATDVQKAVDMSRFVYDRLTAYRNKQKPQNNPVAYDQNVENVLRAIFSLTDKNQIIQQLQYWIDGEERTKNNRMINPSPDIWDMPPPEMHPEYYPV